jgi:hypothetical protein
VGWVVRGNRRHYYRHVRADGRWKKVYVPLDQAPLAEKCDELDRQNRLQMRRQEREDREHQVAADAALGELASLAEIVTQAALLVAGYYRHDRGPWRKRRIRR